MCQPPCRHSYPTHPPRPPQALGSGNEPATKRNSIERKILQVLEIVSRAAASPWPANPREPQISASSAPWTSPSALLLRLLLIIISLGRHTSKRWQRYRNADVRGTELKWPFDATWGALSTIGGTACDPIQSDPIRSPHVTFASDAVRGCTS